MKFFKSTIVAAMMALFLGSFSLAAFADPNQDAVAAINTHVDAAIKSLDANDPDAALAHVKQAKRGKKSLNSEQNAPKIGRLSAHFTKANKYIKKGDYASAKSELEKAKHGYNSINF